MQLKISQNILGGFGVSVFFLFNANDAEDDDCIAVVYSESDCMLSFWVWLQSSIGRFSSIRAIQFELQC